ncbi:unnamed protein product [Paramecium sonneborni]|uniref:Uncharacterized protein n=1 Tax=Paramecium sonneborni TaxID=65129 RepID=A0A8S1QU61_9CILI|nr:unnamed protein product [Paramecium sonneborni]
MKKKNLFKIFQKRLWQGQKNGKEDLVFPIYLPHILKFQGNGNGNGIWSGNSLTEFFKNLSKNF